MQRPKVFDFSRGRKTGCLENPSGAAENQRTKLNSHNGPGLVSNQGHLGERPVLQAQANHAPQY